MKRRLLLKWYKWRLRRAYRKWQAMLDEVSCGATLLRYLSVSFSEQERKVDRLYNKCLELEFGEYLP